MFYLGELQEDIILFKIKNFNEGGVVYQPKICHGVENSPNIVDNYEDCDVQAECNLKNILGSIRDLVKS